MKKLFSILAIAIFLPSFAFAEYVAWRDPVESEFYSPILMYIDAANLNELCGSPAFDPLAWTMFVQDTEDNFYLSDAVFATTTPYEKDDYFPLPATKYAGGEVFGNPYVYIGSICCIDLEGDLNDPANCSYVRQATGQFNILTDELPPAAAGIFTPPDNFLASSTASAAEAMGDLAPIMTLVAGIILAIVGINAIIWLVKKAPFAKAK